MVGLGNAFDITSPEDEKRVLTRLFENREKQGFYVEKDGSWNMFSEIRHMKALQETYYLAKKGDLQALRTLMMRHGVWIQYTLQSSDSSNLDDLI